MNIPTGYNADGEYGPFAPYLYDEDEDDEENECEAM